MSLLVLPVCVSISLHLAVFLNKLCLTLKHPSEFGRLRTVINFTSSSGASQSEGGTMVKNYSDWSAVVARPVPLSLLPMTPLEFSSKSQLWVWTVPARDTETNPRSVEYTQTLILKFRLKVDRQNIPCVVCRNNLPT